MAKGKLGSWGSGLEASASSLNLEFQRIWVQLVHSNGFQTSGVESENLQFLQVLK